MIDSVKGGIEAEKNKKKGKENDSKNSKKRTDWDFARNCIGVLGSTGVDN